MSANVTESASIAGITRQCAYLWRTAEPEFATAWDDALEQATDALEAEARRRAFAGYEEYVTCKDGLVYDKDGNVVTQRRYSDSLMSLLLRAHRKDKFRDNQSVEHSGPNGQPVQLATINLTIGSKPDAA